MDFMKQLIEEKKKELSRKRHHNEEMNDNSGRKYRKRSEINAATDSITSSEPHHSNSNSSTIMTASDNDAIVATTTTTTAHPSSGVHTHTNNDDDNNVNLTEIQRRLRLLGEPILLFGETAAQCQTRLKMVEMNVSERITSKSGRSNQLQQILASEVANDIVLNQAAALESGNLKELAATRERDEREYNKYARDKPRTEFKTDEAYCIYFLKRLLMLWERALSERSSEEKRSRQGRLLSATQKSTRVNMKPLFKALRRKEIPDVLVILLKIVDYCRAGQYTKANQEYMVLAIGNAAWPMGVTMVGIHERAGREKISAHQVAHVLNDETQRKYIQGVKRLISFCAEHFPAL